MPKAPERREDALSRERIVREAIAILDVEGEGGLTFRALASRLETGSGALYWHIANKQELLVAATDAIVASALADAPASNKPQRALHEVALAIFDLIDAHAWVGTQLSRAPGQTAQLQIYERIGRQLEALGVRGRTLFTAGSTLLGYILGVSIQNAANARMFDPPVDRSEYLEKLAAHWKQLDANEYAFVRKAATHLAKHDDRAEYLAGLDLILAGIAATR